MSATPSDTKNVLNLAEMVMDLEFSKQYEIGKDVIKMQNFSLHLHQINFHVIKIYMLWLIAIVLGPMVSSNVATGVPVMMNAMKQETWVTFSMEKCHQQMNETLDRFLLRVSSWQSNGAL